MEWAQRWGVPPTVGYNNEQGFPRGYMVTFPGDPASYLEQCGVLVFRLDTFVPQEVSGAQMNKGNMAGMQQGAKGRGSVRMQNFEEKDALQERLSLALQQAEQPKKMAQRVNNAILQEFDNKKY